MERIQIVRVTANEIQQLEAISKQTFYETFSAANTEENMRNYLQQAFSAEQLTSELNDPNVEFYFAKLGMNVIGYLKLNFGRAQTELKEQNAVEIERIYVSIDAQGKKVGQLLYEQAIQIAKLKNVDYLWLGVWEQNSRAINFYKKNGFVEFDKHLFKLGEDEQTDIMMKLQLQAPR